MKRNNLPPEFLKRLRAVTRKRPKIVINHILKYGYLTTEELRTQYGYHHPPRAARDVREEGIPLETFRIKNKEGRSIGAYRFADLTKARSEQLAGRKVFSKQFKGSLMEAHGARCGICLEVYEARYLQVDHRVPYEVSGDPKSKSRDITDYMLLCGSCNRAKSWSCEHCANWLEERSGPICRVCYWANPESYKHIALRSVRRLDVVWTEEEVEVYEKLTKRVKALKKTLPGYVKAVLKRHLRNRK